MTTEKDFYDAIKHLEHCNHYSDLYLVATQEAITLMKQYGKKGEAFRDQVTGKLTYDIPFAYRPYWDAIAKKSAQRQPDRKGKP